MSFFIAAITFATQFKWSAMTSSILTVLLFPRILLDPEMITLWIFHLVSSNQSNSGSSSKVNTDQFTSAVTAFLDYDSLDLTPQTSVLAIKSSEQDASEKYEAAVKARLERSEAKESRKKEKAEELARMKKIRSGVKMMREIKKWAKDQARVDAIRAEEARLKTRALKLLGRRPVPPVEPPMPKGPLTSMILHPRLAALRWEYDYEQASQFYGTPPPSPFGLATSSHVYQPADTTSSAPTTDVIGSAPVAAAPIVEVPVVAAPAVEEDANEVNEGEVDWLQRRAANKREVRPVAPPKPKRPLKKSILHPRVKALRGEYQFVKVVQPVVESTPSTSISAEVASPGLNGSNSAVSSIAAPVDIVAEVSTAVKLTSIVTPAVNDTSLISLVEPNLDDNLPAVEVIPIAVPEINNSVIVAKPVEALQAVARPSIELAPPAASLSAVAPTPTRRPAKPISIIAAPKPFTRGSKLPVKSSSPCHRLSPELNAGTFDINDELMDIDFDILPLVFASTAVDSTPDSDDNMDIDAIDSTLVSVPSFAELLVAIGSGDSSKEQEAFGYVEPMDIEMKDEEDMVDLTMDIDTQVETDMAMNWEPSYVPMPRPIPRGRIPTPPRGYLAAFGPDVFLPIQEIHSPVTPLASAFPGQPVCAPPITTFAVGQSTTTQPPTSAHSSLSAFGPNSAFALTSTYAQPSPSYSPPSPSPAPKAFGSQVSNAFSTLTKPFIASSPMDSQPSTAFSSLTKPFRASKSFNASLANSAVNQARRNGPPAFVIKNPIAWSTSSLDDEEDENGRAQRASKFNKKMRR